MSAYAWPFVALVAVGCATWLAGRAVAAFNANLAARFVKLETSHQALLLAHKDELLPKLAELEDRLGRTEMEMGVRQ